MVKVQSAGLTDVGQKRDHNEDNILVADQLGVFAVADGMGGHAAGEVASQTAIEAVREFIEKSQLNGAEGSEETDPGDDALTHEERVLRQAVASANREVCRAAEKNLSYGGMGTTIAVLYLTDGEAHLSHVGDSRIYRFREGALEVLTQDHSWVNEQVQRKIISEDEARSHRWRNVITRALGNREDVEIDIQSVETKAGDIFVLCSDGLTGMLDNAQIAGALESHSEELQAACQELIRRANEAGGNDNISVVLIRIES